MGIYFLLANLMFQILIDFTRVHNQFLFFIYIDIYLYINRILKIRMPYESTRLNYKGRILLSKRILHHK
jgi:hypothetical protein